MGCSSGSAPSFEEIMLRSITAADAVSQLGSLTASFLDGVPAADLGAPDVGGGESPTIIQLNKAREAAVKKAEKTYATDFPSSTLSPGQVDSGVVLNYTRDPGSLVQVVDVLQVNFENWNLIAPAGQLDQLAKTMAVQVNAQLGAAEASKGEYAVDANDVCKWVVAYGLFTQDDQGDQALVYAFAAEEEVA